jgi:hypothetical protein
MAKHWVYLVLIFALSCDENEATENECVLIKYGVFNLGTYDSIAYQSDGKILSVTRKQPGGNEFYNYQYESNTISIFRSNLLESNKLVCQIDLDQNKRPISRKEESIVYEEYFYDSDKLAYTILLSGDSISFTYNQSSPNPVSSSYYQYSAAIDSRTHLHTTQFTFDEKKNPLKGLIIPIENWNLERYFFENNRTSYSVNGNSFTLTFTYTNDYPKTQLLNFTGFTELTEFDYGCR